jgi:hypothetical protein
MLGNGEFESYDLFWKRDFGERWGWRNEEEVVECGERSGWAGMI